MSIGLGIAISPSFEGSHIPGVSALFSYAKSSFNQGEADPTPTITGTPGGTFTGTSGIVFVSTSTGEIDLSASTIAAHVVTYTVDGVSATFNLSVTATPYASTSSFSFDGINDYFYISSPSLSISDTWSISSWVKTNDKTSHSSSFRGWFNTGGWDVVSNFKISIRSDNGYVAVWEGGSEKIVGNSDISDDNWYNVILIKTASNLTLFINGTQQSIVSNSSTWAFNNIYIGAGGRATNLTTSGMWNGNIDEVSIWDSALSSSAITEIYNSGAPNDLESLTHASSSNLVAWYKMGE